MFICWVIRVKEFHIVSEFSKIKHLFLPEAFCPVAQQRKQLYSVCSISSVCFSSQWILAFIFVNTATQSMHWGIIHFQNQEFNRTYNNISPSQKKSTADVQLMMDYWPNWTHHFFKNIFFKVFSFQFRSTVHVDLQKCAIKWNGPVQGYLWGRDRKAVKFCVH